MAPRKKSAKAAPKAAPKKKASAKKKATRKKPAKPRKVQHVKAGDVPVLVIADWTGLTKKAVYNNIDDGVFIMTKPGHVDFEQAVKAYFRTLRDRGAKSQKTQNITARLNLAKAMQIETQNEFISDQLLHRSIVTDILQSVALQMVSILDALPAAIRRKITTLRAKDLNYLKTEIAKCRNAISAIEITDDAIAESKKQLEAKP